MTTKQFNRLSATKRRILIAQDVIARLHKPKARRFEAVTGTYFYGDLSGIDEPEPETQLQDVLPQIERACEGCAKGALFLAHIGFADNIRVCDLQTTGNPYRLWAEGQQIDDALRDTFSEQMLGRIEWAFEGIDPGFNDVPDWTDRYPDPHKRLIAICENIVRNKGNFKPRDIPGRKGTKKAA